MEKYLLGEGAFYQVNITYKFSLLNICSHCSGKTKEEIEGIKMITDFYGKYLFF